MTSAPQRASRRKRSGEAFAGTHTVTPIRAAAPSMAYATAVFPLDASSRRRLGSAPSAMPARMISRAGRSFTEPPGFNHSALTKSRAPVSPTAPVLTGTSGVLPTKPHNAGSVVFAVGTPVVATPTKSSPPKRKPTSNVGGGWLVTTMSRVCP